MSKNFTQLTETTTIATDDITNIVDVSANQDKKIKASNLWNGKPHGELYLDANATATTIAVASTYYNITTGGLTTTGGTVNNFTHTAATGRLTYNGTEDVVCQINCAITGTVNATLGTNRQVEVAIYKNGVRLANVNQKDYWDAANATNLYKSLGLSGIVTMSNGDYIEVFVTQAVGTEGVIIQQLNLNIAAL